MDQTQQDVTYFERVTGVPCEGRTIGLAPLPKRNATWPLSCVHTGEGDRGEGFRFVLILLTIIALLITTQVVHAQQPSGPFDVFLNSSINKNQPGLFFVNARTGLSNIVVTNGVKHTILGGGVLYQELNGGAVKIAYPDGRNEPFAPIGLLAPNTTVNWVTSSDGTRLAWAVSQINDQSLLSDLYIASADGGDKKLILHTSSTKGVDTIPLAVTDDGAKVYYARQAKSNEPYVLFPVVTDVFSVDVVSGEVTEMPGKSECACAVGFSSNGNLFVRMTPTGDDSGYGARVWDQTIKTDTSITAPGITHRQAGYLLVSRNNTLIVYTSARGVPPAAGVQPERFAIVVIDVARNEQRMIVSQIKVNLRAIAFEASNSAVILTGTDTDGTFKLTLTDGKLLQVSAYTFLGTLK